MRILIADDDPTTLLLLESALTDWGYEVVAVRGGNSAARSPRECAGPEITIFSIRSPIRR
jgi:CheY-like chemotaxis protein